MGYRIAFLFLSLWIAGFAGADATLEFARLNQCQLDGGLPLENCTLGYRRLGRLNADKSNAVVIPTWYTGTSQVLIDSGVVGPGKIVDTTRFHVIAIDAFANGVSSSPSNSKSQPGADFPSISIADMVRASHRLVAETLGFDKVHAVVGISMGGIQVFEWLVQYPEFMSRAVAIEGTPWLTS